MSSTRRSKRVFLKGYLKKQGIYVPKVERPTTILEVLKMLEFPCRLERVKTESSHCVNAVMSLSQLAAATEDPVFNPEVYSTSEEILSFLRRMRGVTLPNSLFKKKPTPFPQPPPTSFEIMEAKVLEEMRVYEEPPKPPRRPLEFLSKPEPEPEVDVKSKKGKKDQKPQKEKPKVSLSLTSFNIHDWRQEMLPVASTTLYPRDPPPSPGLLPELSPPVPVPEPMSSFTRFLETIQPDVRQY